MADLRLFEALNFWEYDLPFGDVAAFAGYIMHQDNTGPVYSALRSHIKQNLTRKVTIWPLGVLRSVIDMPEASALLAAINPNNPLHSASRLLSEVVDHLRDQDEHDEQTY